VVTESHLLWALNASVFELLCEEMNSQNTMPLCHTEMSCEINAAASYSNEL
jgi:hypothetical protein